MSAMRSILTKPTTIVVASALLFVISIFMTTLIPQQYMPEITFPIISVSTLYSGAGPEEIESSITKILERALTNVSGLDTITSTSSEGLSNIVLRFDWDVNLDVATNEVRDKLDQTRDFLPTDAKAPIISKIDINALTPVMYISVSSPLLNADDIKPYAEDIMQPMLEQIQGVSNVTLIGGRSMQIRVEVLQNRLEAYNVTMTEINRAIASQNIQMGAGSIIDGDRKIMLRADGLYKSPEDVANVVVTYRTVGSGNRSIPVLLRDVANVSMDYEDETGYAEMNGYSTFTLIVYKASDANIVNVARNVTKQLPLINEKLPDSINMVINWDASGDVTKAIMTVVQSALLGAFFSVVVLILFLRNIRSALIVALTMPLSILFALMMMYFFNLTLNVMSLAGLNLGVGMIVDGGIVLLENITRYREKGVGSKTSAILGSQEMMGAVTGGTLTTVAVFLPMVIFRKELGVVGVIFTDLSFTIVISLLSSLLFAIVLIPVLAGVYLPVYTKKQRDLKGSMLKLDNIMSPALIWLDDRYASAIRWSLGHRRTVLLTVFSTLVIAIALLATAVKFEMMPAGGSSFYGVSYKLPEGTPLSVSKDTGQQLQAFLSREYGSAVKDLIVIAGEDSRGNEASNQGQVMLLLPEFNQRTLNSAELAERARKYYDFFPDAEFTFADMTSFGGGSSGISFKISSQDQVALELVANQMVEILSDVPIIKEVDSNLDSALPQVEIEIDRNKAYSLGLNIASIANELNYNIEGTAAGQYSFNGKDIDIYTRLQESDRMALADLDRIFLKSSNSNETIVLSSIATLKRGFGQVSIKREDQARQLEITAKVGLDEKGKVVAESEASSAAKIILAERLQLPSNVTMKEGGSQADFVELIPKLAGVMLVAVLLVYGVMASQFESLADPFIIILTIFTLPIGPILIYVFAGEPLSAYSLIGFIMLIGIVVNNGIVLVDYTNLLRKRSLPLFEAIILSGRSRLRPILMTTLTTILGMLPMAFNKGEGTEMTQPIGVTVLGGMISSSIMTLFLVPVLYYIFNQKDEQRLIALSEKRKQDILSGHIISIEEP